MNIGRNDPCPCGSGKKYKKCCFSQEENISGSTVMQNTMSEVRRKLEGREYSSQQEAQVEIESFIHQENVAPVAEFHGLSPEQMFRFLHFPFASPTLIQFKEDFLPPLDSPALTLFSLLAEAIGEKGLKSTAKGNLPQRFCREAALSFWGKEKYEERTRIGNIHSEMDFFALHCLRLVAGMAGLVRKYKGKFILTAQCRKKIAAQGMGAVYPDLFMAYVQKFNWAYHYVYQEIPFIQQSFLFTLYLLSKNGSKSRPQAFYEDAFIQAFPDLINEIKEVPYQSPEESIRDAYFNNTLKDFAEFFGLATLQPISEINYRVFYEIKKSSFLDQYISFTL